MAQQPRIVNGVQYQRGADGRWRPVQGGAIQLAPPSARNQAQTRQAVNEAEASELDPRIAEARAREAEAQARLREAELARGDRARLSEQQINDLIARRDRIDALNAEIDAVEDIYAGHFQGSNRGGIAGLGGDINVRGRVSPDFLSPANERLREAGRRLMGGVKDSTGTTGGEANSLAEVRLRFGPYLPAPGDSDDVIEDKLRSLRRIVQTERQSVLAQLPADMRNQPAQPQAAPNIRETRPSDVEVTRGRGTTQERVVNPALRAVGQRVSTMLADPDVPDEAITEFLQQSGVDPAQTNISRALRERKTENFQRWRTRHPELGYPIGDDFFTDTVTREIERNPAASIISNADAFLPSNYFIQAGQALTGNRLDDLTGNPELAQAGIDMLRSENPVSSVIGDVSGAGMVMLPAGRAVGAAGRAVSTVAPRAGAVLNPTRFAAMTPRAVAGDAAYGAYADTGNEDGSIARGAITGAAGGMFGRGAVNTAGGVLRGVNNAGARHLTQQGVPLTPGDILRESTGPAGRIVTAIEDRLTDVPFVGAARMRGHEGLNRAAFREIGVNQTGSAGIEAGRQVVNNAYSFLDNVNLPLDAQYAGTNATIRANLPNLPAFGNEIGATLNNLDNVSRGGSLLGRDWQSAIRSVRGDRASVAGEPFADRAVASLGDVEDNLMGLATRQGGPDIAPQLANANQTNARFQTLAAALDNGPAQRADEIFTADRLNTASMQNARNFGGRVNSVAGNRPFYDLTQAGMRAMSNVVPNSGTAGRTAVLAGGAGLIAGGGGAGVGAAVDGSEGAQTGAGVGVGGVAGLTAALAAIYGRRPQAVLQALMLSRPDLMRNAGEALTNGRNGIAPRLGGMFGASALPYSTTEGY